APTPAGLLAGAFAPLAPAPAPPLLPMAPPGARELPLPVPLFALALALQVLVVYGLLALAGLRLARRRGLEPAPLLSALWIGRRPGPVVRPLAVALGIGLACGLSLVAAVALVQRLAPRTLPPVLPPPSFGSPRWPAPRRRSARRSSAGSSCSASCSASSRFRGPGWLRRSGSAPWRSAPCMPPAGSSSSGAEERPARLLDLAD